MSTEGGVLRASFSEEVAFKQGYQERKRMSPAEKLKEGSSSKCKGVEEISCWKGKRNTVAMVGSRWSDYREWWPDPRGQGNKYANSASTCNGEDTTLGGMQYAKVYKMLSLFS